MLTSEIREKFLQYFKRKGHTLVPSSAVVPHDDPTLLFINAGMNQFKDVFLGKTVRDYKCAASSQKCVRVGGKHNDLENVGHTLRHLTFFEMLGNFSFGDYFKKEAIQFSWEVSTEVFGFDPDRLWPTVYTDDDEAFEIWTQYVPAERITRFGEKENFWSMGDTGPCGPCSEILYDRGEAFGAAKNPLEDIKEERYLEFWNLVFMQYNRDKDGVMKPLPKPSIDTGAGLERVVDLITDAKSVYDTDILRALIQQVEQVSGVTYNPENKKLAPAFRVIADHIRCLAFSIADGVQPSNVDRGYVLRKVLRRAVRYGRQLGMKKPFLSQIIPCLIKTMGEAYPELKKAERRIEEILIVEEEAFIKTLQRGGNILNEIIEHAKTHGRQISGEEAFKLKDTYGFPIEEITLLAIDANLTVDTDKYEALELEAKERSRSVHKKTKQVAEESLFENFIKENGPTQFVGYDKHTLDSQVLALVVDGKFVDTIEDGIEGIVILNKTPFYAEQGGQVGDTGLINAFEVTDCQSPYKGVTAHIGKAKGNLIKVGETVSASINSERRQKIENNHTATHLLHWALHQVLGEHVKQAGSVVDTHRLRFDFSHHKGVTQEEIREIEDLVNERIRENKSVNSYELPYEDVQKREDIKQFFGEKYDSKVRVIDIDFSKELCGGTHTQAIGNIGLFRIAKESSIAAGIRRIEAVTGKEAELLMRESDRLIERLAETFKTNPQTLESRLEKLLEDNKALQQELKIVKKSQQGDLIRNLLSKVITVNETPLLATEVELEPKEMREFADTLLDQLSSGVLVLGAKSGDKCSLLVRVSNDLIGKGIKANEIIKQLSPIIEGGGGGKADSAQAGGKNPTKLSDAINQAKKVI